MDQVTIVDSWQVNFTCVVQASDPEKKRGLLIWNSVRTQTKFESCFEFDYLLGPKLPNPKFLTWVDLYTKFIELNFK